MQDSDASWTVLVVDDNPDFLTAARSWMASRAEFEIVGTAEDGERALAAVQTLDPDLVLMDAAMPVLDGFDATRRMRESGDDRWVILISFHDSGAVRQEAWASGADGFLSKADLAERLPSMVRDLAEGRGIRPGSGPRGTRSAGSPEPSARRPKPSAGPGQVERRRLGFRKSLARTLQVLVLDVVRFLAGTAPALQTVKVYGGPHRVPSKSREREG